MVETKKIGILGGTFDPIHFGHIHLALQLYEIHKLDEVYFIPVKINPLKKDSPASGFDRLEMLKLALSHLPQFKVLDIEIKREGPSYTIDTLNNLKAEHSPNTKFYLLLGDDVLDRFPEWRQADEIIKLATPIIGSRTEKKRMLANYSQYWTTIPLLEISATDIRKRLKENKYCEHLLPKKVIEYIKNKKLYQ